MRPIEDHLQQWWSVHNGSRCRVEVFLRQWLQRTLLWCCSPAWHTEKHWQWQLQWVIAIVVVQGIFFLFTSMQLERKDNSFSSCVYMLLSCSRFLCTDHFTCNSHCCFIYECRLFNIFTQSSLKKKEIFFQLWSSVTALVWVSLLWPFLPVTASIVCEWVGQSCLSIKFLTKRTKYTEPIHF